jgi:phage/plasmid-associated DNA primase
VKISQSNVLSFWDDFITSPFKSATGYIKDKNAIFSSELYKSYVEYCEESGIPKNRIKPISHFGIDLRGKLRKTDEPEKINKKRVYYLPEVPNYEKENPTKTNHKKHNEGEQEEYEF